METILVAALLAAVIVLLLVLLLRGRPADPGIALLQAAQDRQAERLGSLTGEIKATLSDAQKQQGEALARLTADLTRMHAQAAAAAAQGFSDARTAEAQAKAALQAAMSELTANVLQVQGSTALAQKTARAAEALQDRLKEMREANDARLADIQKSVNEQLADAVEKKMAESFNRVIDQFTAVQKAMGDVQAVTAQIGDIKRLFGNVKTRGGWAETQVRSLLDDIMPGAYEQNVKVKEGSADAVEFCVVMPNTGDQRVLLPIDSKFPTEDFERLQAAWDAADVAAEAQARRALETRIRQEAAKIAQKYINPPRTTEFAVLYLPTEGLYAEVARVPGLIDRIGREHKIVLLGPSLLPAMLRTIQLGHVSLALSKNAESVKGLLSATKAEMAQMDQLLGLTAKQIGTVTTTIGKAQRRTQTIVKKLRGVEAMDPESASQLIGPTETDIEDEEAP
ncbi:MAG: DNA recombination protein RmuC [Alphaproteobacteria bacterium]|nr:DNA recombination protein RmuC [Alphaproteobacteria bacterium]